MINGYYLEDYERSLSYCTTTYLIANRYQFGNFKFFYVIVVIYLKKIFFIYLNTNYTMLAELRTMTLKTL
jgi:hypothetical protein